MNNKKTITAELIEEYMDKFPDTPSLTLAKTIYNDNILLFSSVDSIRNMIRYRRGQIGDIKRKNLEDKSRMKKAGKYNPFDSLPEGLKKYSDWKPFNVEGKHILLLSDLHVPYHDKLALATALEYGRTQNVDTIIINGDGMDFYQASFWDKDPRRRSLPGEIITLREVLGGIRSMFPYAKIIYKIGNHEERWERYLKVKAPELMGFFDEEIDLLSYRGLFNADKLGIDIVKDKKILKVGLLHIVHGHEFWRTLTNPVNPARGLFLKGKQMALCSHHHQTSDHTENTLSSDIISCWSIGCLCDLHPDYAPINKWNHGFAVIHRQGDKQFEVLNKKIIKDKVY